MNFGAYFECILLEEAHARQKHFKVRINALFPEIDEEDKFNPKDNISKESGKKRMINSNIDGIGNNYTTTNYILALNHTGLHYKLKGDVFKDRMDSTDGVTDPRGGGVGDPAFETHDHIISEPITLNNFVFENLNNVKIPKNTKMYGFFINGAADTRRFAVTYIEGSVPYKDDDPIAYQK